jgi:branched-subunit amino acid transport protein
MADWEVWLTIAALTVATACTRSSFWMIGHHITIPPRIQGMLRYAPACALAAIIAPDMLQAADHTFTFSLANPKLLAALASAACYLLRKSMLETIVFGMLVFTALRIWLA